MKFQSTHIVEKLRGDNRYAWKEREFGWQYLNALLNRVYAEGDTSQRCEAMSLLWDIHCSNTFFGVHPQISKRTAKKLYKDSRFLNIVRKNEAIPKDHPYTFALSLQDI